MLSQKTADVLDQLRKNTEGESEFDGECWGSVYLENARPSDMTPHQFAGHLSALKEAGLYAPQGTDGVFGDVRMERAA